MNSNRENVCIKCGELINIGDDIGWRRRGETYGLSVSVAWHKRCEYQADNIENVAKIRDFAILRSYHGPFKRYPKPAPKPAMVYPASSPLAPIMPPAMPVSASLASIVPSVVPTPRVAPHESGVTLRSTWWKKLDAVMACGFTRVLLIGPPGTGKSTTADRDGLRVTCHEDSGPESMIGTFIQKDGNTIWIDGPSVMAMKNGSRIVKDEIDHTSPECISLLYALLDDSPSIMLPTGEYVQAKPGYQVICTSNANPSDLPDAILDRIEAVIVADIPHDNALNTVSGPKADKLRQLTQNYYRNSVSKDAYVWKGSPTLRRMRNFGKLLAAGLNEDVAAQCVFGNASKEILSSLTTV